MAVGMSCFLRIGAVLLMLSSAALAQGKTRRPESAKRDEKLGERLVRKAVTDADEDLMESVTRLMNEAARRLEIEFDAGDETQDLQRRILNRLNRAIRVAASQRRLRLQSDQRSRSDKRRMSKAKPRTSDKEKRQSGDRTTAASSSTVGAGGNVAEHKTPGGDLQELRRSWGHLPMREREEIIQGIAESFLERYRDRIERYYRALQETED